MLKFLVWFLKVQRVEIEFNPLLDSLKIWCDSAGTVPASVPPLWCAQSFLPTSDCWENNHSGDFGVRNHPATRAALSQSEHQHHLCLDIGFISKVHFCCLSCSFGGCSNVFSLASLFVSLFVFPSSPYLFLTSTGNKGNLSSYCTLRTFIPLFWQENSTANTKLNLGAWTRAQPALPHSGSELWNSLGFPWAAHPSGICQCHPSLPSGAQQGQAQATCFAHVLAFLHLLCFPFHSAKVFILLAALPSANNFTSWWGPGNSLLFYFNENPKFSCSQSWESASPFSPACSLKIRFHRDSAMYYSPLCLWCHSQAWKGEQQQWLVNSCSLLFSEGNIKQWALLKQRAPLASPQALALLIYC